jgi:hypothetical protein
VGESRQLVRESDVWVHIGVFGTDAHAVEKDEEHP